jgi:S1-C subfamily serine protease
LQPVRLPDTLRQSLHRDVKTAAIVLEVEPDGPAHKAGLVIGDIIVSLSGQPIARLEDIHSQLQGATIGKQLSLGFVRGGALQEASVVVGERTHGGRE